MQIQPKQSSRVRRRKQIRVINYIIMPPVSREDGAEHIFVLIVRLASIRCRKIPANKRRTIVRLYKSLNSGWKIKIIESRFFDHTINLKPQFCLTCAETHNCASLLNFIARLASIRCRKIPANSIPIRHLLGMTIFCIQPKQSSRVRRRRQIRVINYFIIPPVSREDGAVAWRRAYNF